MFELPSGTSAANLMTEHDPLELPDNVEEFRALCWALYALYVVFLNLSCWYSAKPTRWI
jgi:hypothetical protein